jgi:Conserved TM helix
MDSQLRQGLGDAWALVTTFVPKLLGFLLVLLVGWLIAKALSKAVELLLAKTGFAKLVRKAGLGGLAGRQFGPVLGTISYVFLLGLGIIAALNQLGIATTVTEPVLITVLATVGGVIVVGAGGGLIRPMQHRWEYWLNRAQSEVAGDGSAAGQAAPPADAPWERNQPQPPPSDTPTPPEGISRPQ